MAKYKLIKNTPCSEDLFEGKSHTAIAKQICNTIKEDENCKMIGIDGDWGSGKSNLLELVKQNINHEKQEYHFFLYDAWGHQEDIQRRAILENLTAFILEEKIIKNKDKWTNKSNSLIAKTRETEVKTLPKLSIGVIISIITIVLSPAFKPLSDWVKKDFSEEWGIVVPFMPFIIFLILFIYFCVISKSCKKALQEFVAFYQKDRKDTVTTEVISETQPSSKKFREWVQNISKDLEKNQNLILVFDNMDRLPANKVQELWSSIHSFFSEDTYSNIWVIIPFDRKHIRTAFKNEDIENISYGDDFINKTFDVVYRVSPPTLSDWKQYFRGQWNKAFGYSIDEENYQNITQIYDLLETDYSPRKIIAFINELITIKQISTEVPDPYIALYILGKSKINKEGISEFFSPSFLGAIDFLYKNDENLPKYLASIHYQLPPDKVKDIIFTEKLKKALDNKDIKTAEGISEYAGFADVLENSIASVSNFSNAIEVLDKVFEKYTQKEVVKHSWESIYEKMGAKSENVLKDYQIILLKNIKNPNIYLKRILGDFLNQKEFTPTQYFNDIQKLSEIKRVDVFGNIEPKALEVEPFIEFVKLAKSEIDKYKISCDKVKLDEYLSNIEIEHIEDITYIPYLKDKYTFDKYKQHIKELIPQNIGYVSIITTLYTRLKELDRPISKELLSDNQIYNLFSQCDKEDTFYPDLMCMRIARFNNYSSSWVNYFNSVLQKADDSFLEKIVERIEYYTSYGDILLNLFTMDYEWYKKIAQKLTENNYGVSSANIFNLLKKYDEVRENLIDYVDGETLIGRLNDWSRYASSINRNTIYSIPIKFFEDAKNIDNKLTKHCIEIAKKYLENRSKEDWITDIQDENFAYQIIEHIDLKITQNAFEALKEIVNKFVENDSEYSDCDLQIKKLLAKAQKDCRDLAPLIKNVRDKFIRGDIEMNTNIFDVLGELLLEYGKLTEKKEVLRTILTDEVVDCYPTILIKHSNQIKELIKNEEEKDDFVSHIVEKAKTEEKIKLLASELGIEIPKEKENKND